MRALIAFFLSVSIAWAADALVLQSPLERHVFQRDPNNTAAVAIVGNLTGRADVIEAQAQLLDPNSPSRTVTWQTITATPPTDDGRFTGRLSLSAGGWYQLTVRARCGPDIIATQTVEKVGVGEVFITTGQSNSANYGWPRQKAQDDRVVYFDGKAFLPAQDPMPGAFGTGGAPWPILGDLITAHQRVPVCFRSVTLGFAPVRQWLKDAENPSHPYYQTMIQRTRHFGKHGFRAVLWHQGESDADKNTSADAYYRTFRQVITDMRRDIAFPVDWFVAGAAFHPDADATAQQQVRQGQQMLSQQNIAFPGPVTDDLLGEKYRHDGIHFNQLGLTTHAQRWYNILAAKYTWQTR